MRKSDRDSLGYRPLWQWKNRHLIFFLAVYTSPLMREDEGRSEILTQRKGGSDEKSYFGMFGSGLD